MVKKKSKKAIKSRTGNSKKNIGIRLMDFIENKASNVRIYNQVKRMDMPDGGRDFTVRVCWEVEKGEKRFESKWEGFATTQQAVKDLLKKCGG